MTEHGENEAFVFVSYAREDKARVARLIDQLATRGINVWWDGKIDPGSPWRHAIQNHLDRAVCTLVVWTEHSVESNFVQSEASRAAAGTLVPVKLDTAARIPVGFTEIHCCDLTGWDEGSSPEFERLVSVLGRFIERGPRPIDGWMLQNPQWQVNDSVSAAGELREKVGSLRSFAELSTSSVRASEDLRLTLREIYKTYKAVNDAVKRFLSPVVTKDEIDATPYLDLERDDFRAQVEKGRGHCGLISVHYGRHGGLRDWLAERVQPEQLREADALFASFSGADRDAFVRMVSIADMLKNQSRAIVNLLLADQPILARERIKEARQELAPLEAELSKAMRELQETQAVLGYPGG
jgi:TIR domain